MAGSPAFTLALTGTGFLQSSVVLWNGAALTTTYAGNTILSAQVPASDLVTVGTAQVAVQNPKPGGGLSAAQSFGILMPNAAPVLTGINPSSAAVGSANLNLTLTGSSFASTSIAQWNGIPIATTYQSATTLTAEIPASDFAASGVFPVTVTTPSPGGGTSAAKSFTVLAAGNGTQLSVNIEANSIAWDPASQRLYLSLPSTAGANGNSVQALDPVTGNLGISGYAGSEPDSLSVSANGKYIYVGLDGASSLQRLNLPMLTQDIAVPMGVGFLDGPYYSGDVEAAPNADETVAVTRTGLGKSTAGDGGVLIFDDATQRPARLCGESEPGCTGSLFGGRYDSIQWNADGTEMLAANTRDSGADFYTIPVTPSGFGAVKDYAGRQGTTI